MKQKLSRYLGLAIKALLRDSGLGPNVGSLQSPYIPLKESYSSPVSP